MRGADHIVIESVVMRQVLSILANTLCVRYHVKKCVCVCVRRGRRHSEEREREEEREGMMTKREREKQVLTKCHFPTIPDE